MQGQLTTMGTLDLAILEQALGSGSTAWEGSLYQPNLHLYVNNLTVTKKTALSELTEASYTGYAAAESITFNTPIQETDGSYTGFCATVQFAMGASSAPVAQTVYGAYLTGSGADSASLLAIGEFPTPLTISLPGQGFLVNLGFNQGATVPNMEVNAIQ